MRLACSRKGFQTSVMFMTWSIVYFISGSIDVNEASTKLWTDSMEVFKERF